MPGAEHFISGDDTHPAPARDAAPLEPMFGTRFASQTFHLVNYKNETRLIQMEAYLEDPVKKTWAVNRIVNVTEGRKKAGAPDKTKTHVHLVRNKMTFMEALEVVTDFENTSLSKPEDAIAVYPDFTAMGYKHYKAFAEREGFVFDDKGKAHPRPDHGALPAGISITAADMASANANMQRPAQEFHGSGTTHKIPNTLFLFDNFTRAAKKTTMEEDLNGLRALDIMDGFVNKISGAADKMSTYCDSYFKLGQGKLMLEAADLLEAAAFSIRQLKAYGVDTREYENFVIQCKITCHVLHAEGLYDLMSNGIGDFQSNETQFQTVAEKAIEAYKTIDSTVEGLETLKTMLVSNPRPKVPEAIDAFVENYRKQRQTLLSPRKPPAP